MADNIDILETLERKPEGDKAVSRATQDEVQAGSEQQSQGVKDYY